MVAMDTEESREQLWHRLDNESGRAYEAFKVYMYLPPAERSVVRAWREWSGNPDAKREPPFFYNWARDFAWSERARAHDHHLEVIREAGMEEAIKEEATRQARQVEQVRGRYHELMAIAYERAIEHLESEEFLSQMRSQDVINIVKLHFEFVEREGGFEPPQEEADWSEDELAEFDRIVEEIEGEEAQEEPDEGTEEGEEDSKESENGQN
jgi:hypothetical protein